MSGTVRETPADFRNGDLISRLLAATPPYQTNSTFVPPGLYFSEMLKRFVQAKSCPPTSSSSSSSSSPNKRGRKRIWREGAGLKTAATGEPQPSESKQKRTSAADFGLTEPAAAQFPLWYPPFYPGAYPPPPPPPPPVYFKTPDAEPLDLQTRCPDQQQPQLKQDRHYSAFRVPEPSKAEDDVDKTTDNKRGTSYLMGNLTKIYRQVAPTDEEKIIDVEGDGSETGGGEPKETEKKNCKDLTALIGLELVVDYVKHGNNKDGKNDQNVKFCQNSS